MKKVLIIEDDKAMASILQESLQDEGFGATFASDGIEGLERVKSDKPDIILLDVMMPKMSGKETLAELRGNPETKDIPVIMLTNVGDDIDTISEVVSLGTPDYLVKSNTSMDMIVERVKQRLAGEPAAE